MKLTHPSVRFGRRLVLGGGACLALSGCFGSFNAIRNLWEWNDDFDNKWVKWLVFLGLSIIPVYGLFAFADALVLNSVEFWTGKNPVQAAPGERTITRVATADPARLRLEVRRAGRLELVVYCQSLGDGAFQILDESGRQLSLVRELGDGSLELNGGDEQVLARLDAGAVQRVYARVKAGRAAHTEVALELGSQTRPLVYAGAQPTGTRL
jgi:hypothetical protein